MNEILSRFKRALKGIGMVLPNSIVKRLISLEILFWIGLKIGETSNVKDLYMLLSKIDIATRNSAKGQFLLYIAKKRFKTLSQKEKYRETLELYNNLPPEIRLFDVDNDQLLYRKDQLELYTSRTEDYEDFFTDCKVSYARESAETGEAYSVEVHAFDDEDKEKIVTKLIRLSIPDVSFTHLGVESRHREAGNISVTIQEILDSASFIDETLGGNFRRRVLENQIFKVADGELEPASEISLSGVTNLEGQVGAGKSVFAMALTYALTQKGKRIVILVPDVISAIKMADEYRTLGIDALPLVGKEKTQYIDYYLKKSPSLSSTASEILTAPCLLNAFVSNPAKGIIPIRQEPCSALVGVDGKAYNCPFWHACPKALITRRLASADVVITTLQGFCYCSADQNGGKFFEYALHEFDVVIADEIDSLVNVCDGIFSPSVGVTKFLADASETVNNVLTSSFASKDSDYSEFVVLIASFNALLTNIKVAVENPPFAKSHLKAFRSRGLLDVLKHQKNEKIDDRVLSVVEAYVDDHSDLNVFFQFESLARTGRHIDSNMCTAPLVNGLVILSREAGEPLCDTEAKEIVDDLSRLQIERIAFVLCVKIFEKIYKELNQIIDDVAINPALKRPFSESFLVHQEYLPNSPLGNLLALSVREDDLYILKQFAYGRMLLLAMPYLVFSENDEPVGPNILLMSGTGYMPGSSRFHVGNSVDYIIQATDEKREYISKSRIVACDKQTRVSGKAEDAKEDAIWSLVNESMDVFEDALKDDKRTLVVVNSYDQCEVARAAIEALLKRNHKDAVVYNLVRGNTESGDTTWHRNDIEDFNKRVLIAPMAMIARGHNILDSTGNSWFDSVILLVRPMNDPTDYSMHVCQVNGYIYSKYKDAIDLQDKSRIEVLKEMRRDAGIKMHNLENPGAHSLSQLSDEEKRDVISSLFVLINQTFGRLCRIGSEMKKTYPTLYFVDGAFRAVREQDFDTVEELHSYIKWLIHESENKTVARTLYEPFYKALGVAINKEE